MRTVFYLLLVLFLISCTNRNTDQRIATSYWMHLKDSFPLMNLTSFVINSQLDTTYKTYPTIRHKVIDSILGTGRYYLYSWQEDTPGLIGFTALADYDEHGSRIIYFIFNGKDSLLSFTEVAHRASEGGIIYDKRSKFKAKDSLLAITSASTIWDLSKPAPPPKLDKSKGDSTFFHLIFQKDGRVVEKPFAVKKELNLN